MATLTYEFEELPLVISNGIPAGQINGCAEIEFTTDGLWQIGEVCVEGYQSLTSAERAAGKRPWIYVKAPIDLMVMVAERLEIQWKHRVDEAVREAIDAEREAAAEYRADMRREHRMWLS